MYVFVALCVVAAGSTHISSSGNALRSRLVPDNLLFSSRNIVIVALFFSFLFTWFSPVFLGLVFITGLMGTLMVLTEDFFQFGIHHNIIDFRLLYLLSNIHFFGNGREEKVKNPSSDEDYLFFQSLKQILVGGKKETGTKCQRYK